MRILLVEDDARAAVNLSTGLREQGFAIDVAATGIDAMRCFAGAGYDLLLLDLVLPDMDGLDILREIRSTGKNILTIIVSARDKVHERINGLDLGADAYLTKPFEFSELLAVIRSLVRRKSSFNNETLRIADLTIDFVNHVATRNHKRLELTPKEFQLLGLFVRRPGEVLSRAMISQEIWHIAYDSGTNVVDVHIRRLRAKIDDPFPKKLIRTVRGVGYVLRASESGRSALASKI